ncbi:MAG TPA: hypothetical protein VJG67_03245 [Candidatus Paceibacterota bacterium]
MKEKSLSRKHFFIDLFVVLLLPVLAYFLTIYLTLSFLVSILLFFVVPLAYLLVRDRHLIKKALLSALVTVPATVIIDYFAMKDKAWYDSTVLPFRILNDIPLEDFFWFGAWFAYIVVFYAYFVDKRPTNEEKISRRYASLLKGWFTAVIIFFLLYIFMEEYLYIPYFYLFFTVIIGIVPMLWILSKRHSFVYKFSKVATYFFGLNFLHELSAQKTHQWVFPGDNFVGWVTVAGISFPIEELLMFMMLGSFFVLCWYEYFIDDFR